MININPKILERVNIWLTPFFDKETQQTVKNLIAFEPKNLEESFYKNLEFGTGGMRGIMGVGPNRVNKYTIGKATQGLANTLLEMYPNQEVAVAIAHDCRNNSDFLARTAAEVLSANGIKVYLFTCTWYTVF